MNLSLLFDALISWSWYLLPVVVVVTTLKSPWFKGMMGEAMVNFAAKRRLDPADYHLIKNVTLPTEEGSTQIDHIIVSRFGIFVIETKNMKGWIYGSAHQKRWTQKIFRHTNSFQNPLHQNHKHVKTLASCLGIDDEYIHSLIVFVGDSQFKTPMPENVTYAGGYIRYIKSKEQPVINDAEVAEIANKIESGRLTPSFRTHRNHVKHVKQIVEQKAKEHHCARCGSPMIRRVAKKGANKGRELWGCSSFPKCRHVENI